MNKISNGQPVLDTNVIEIRHWEFWHLDATASIPQATAELRFIAWSLGPNLLPRRDGGSVLPNSIFTAVCMLSHVINMFSELRDR